MPPDPPIAKQWKHECTLALTSLSLTHFTVINYVTHSKYLEII